MIRIAFVSLVTLSSLARAQLGGDCLSQRFHPDFQPRSLEFGVDVEINGEHLIVVDRFGGADIYTYRRDAATGAWVLNQKVPGGSGGDAVLDGDRLLTADLSVDPRGGARLYEFDGSRWNESAVLAAPPDAEPGTGEYVAMAGPHAAVGNGGEDVHIFFEREGVWEYVETILSPDSPTVRSDFGEALEADRRFLFVGAPIEEIFGGNNGAVYVYEWSTDGRVTLRQKMIAEPAALGPLLGASISVDGDRLAIGAWGRRVGEACEGAVFEYQFDGERWVLVDTILDPNPGRAHYFGWDVTLRGRLMAVGARGVNSAYLYQRDRAGGWRQAARVRLEGIFGFDYAESVALNGDQQVVGGSEATVMGEDQGVADVLDLDCLLCAPDLDLDGVLTIFDFLTFQNLFDAGEAAADFDGDGELTIFDFLAFQNAFDAGCE